MLIVVIPEIKFVQRPPTSVSVSASSTIVINCTAQLMHGIPESTQWEFPVQQCRAGSAKKTVLSNGTLVIQDATEWDSGTYLCHAGNKEISAKVEVRVAGTRRFCVFVVVACTCVAMIARVQRT